MLGLTQPLAIVDIETNGLNHITGRIIEVGVVRVENGVITDTYSQIINPQSELPQFITGLTGITQAQVDAAPTFAEVADQLGQLLDQAILVAHNVRFDYSFLKQEFKRLGAEYVPKQLCTVKLSRKLYPQERSHKLESIIGRYNFEFQNRHRAYDDAHVLWQFLCHVQENFDAEELEKAARIQIKRPALPRGLTTEKVAALPDGPGVYIFEDSRGQPLYIGKSVTLKKRVLSHFSQDHASVQEFKIAQQIHDVNVIETAGELSALLLESQLIKERQPLYNRRLRKVEKLITAVGKLDPKGYITVSLEEAEAIDPHNPQALLAVYERRGKARDSLEAMRKLYDLCPRLLGLEKGKGACFMRQLHKCRGACLGEESNISYNERLLFAFERQRIQAWVYDGPVVIDEISAHRSQPADGFVIDNWRVVAQVSRLVDGEVLITPRDYGFDLDTYKILRQFLAYKADSLRITRLNKEQRLAWGL